jgi:hypothetical protein
MDKELKLIFKLKYKSLQEAFPEDKIRTDEKLQFIIYNFLWDYAYHEQKSDTETPDTHAARFCTIGFDRSEFIDFAKVSKTTIEDVEEDFFTWVKIAEEIYE